VARSSERSPRGGPDQLGDLTLHELLNREGNAPALDVCVLVDQHLSDHLLIAVLSAPATSGASFRRTVRSPTSMSAAVAGTTFRPAPSCTTLWDVTVSTDWWGA
jgi:hypothetical protein